MFVIAVDAHYAVAELFHPIGLSQLSSRETMNLCRTALTRCFWFACTSTWLSALFGGGMLRAAEPAKPKSDAAWISLFDGKTLAGWHKNPARIGHGTGGRWTVENGEIHGEQDPPGNGGILLTDRKFGDFELVLELKPDWGCDSGLFLRANDQGQCFQMMVDYHEAGNVGHIYGEGTGGFNNRPFSLFGKYDAQQRLIGLTTKPVEEQVPPAYSIPGADWLKAWKLGDWNTARVVCRGQPAKIATWLNGVKVSEFDGQTFAAPNYDRQKVAETLGPQGGVALQVHGGASWPVGAKCRWKNIKIKPLE